jgi:20S proteasome subunit beta 7
VQLYDMFWCPGSYGSTKRYKSFQRVQKINEFTAIGAGGELSDFQYILQLLDELTTQDFTMDDSISLTPKEIYSYLSRVLYNRRNK